MRGLGLSSTSCPFSLLVALQINAVLFFTHPSVSKLALLHGGQGWFSNRGCQAQGQRSEVASTAHGLCENKQRAPASLATCRSPWESIQHHRDPRLSGPGDKCQHLDTHGLDAGPTGHSSMNVHATKAWEKTHKTSQCFSARWVTGFILPSSYILCLPNFLQ